MKQKKMYTEEEIREIIDTFDWENGINCQETIISIDFFREMRDKIDWEALCKYNYFFQEDFIKEFIDYLPKIYREYE